MSDYRFEIVRHHDIPSLHIMIDSEPIAETHIPLGDIQEAIDRRVEATAKEMFGSHATVTHEHAFHHVSTHNETSED